MISGAGLWPALLDVSTQMSLPVYNTAAEGSKCQPWLLVLCGTFFFLDGEAEAGPQSYLCPKVTRTSDRLGWQRSLEIWPELFPRGAPKAAFLNSGQ